MRPFAFISELDGVAGKSRQLVLNIAGFDCEDRHDLHPELIVLRIPVRQAHP
jgi:hypothetical protein